MTEKQGIAQLTEKQGITQLTEKQTRQETLASKEFGKDVGGEYRWQQKTAMKREIMVAQ